ncbi:MAG: DNA-directed RNA polymerase subunit beta [Pseudomonadota bacterium]
MVSSFTAYKKIRKNFGRVEQVASIPNLIELQKNSYDSFLQTGVEADKRKNVGLHQVFNSVFPIEESSGQATLEYVKYELSDPILRGGNYFSTLKGLFRLIIWDIDEDTEVREIKGIKEQEVFLGDIPMMTNNGTFVVNGTERVVVSQMHRSPGAFFDHDRGKTHNTGKFLYSARVIPYRGSWLDFEFDGKDILYFRIDRKRKLLVSTLLRALGMSSADILNHFYNKLEVKKVKAGWAVKFDYSRMQGLKLKNDLVDANTNKILVESGVKITPKVIKKLKEEKFEDQLVTSEDLIGKFVGEDIYNPDSGEIYLSIGDEIKSDKMSLFDNANIEKFTLLDIDNNIGGYIRNTLYIDRNTSPEEALVDIFKVVRPGEPATAESAKDVFNNVFFNQERYDLSSVGRVKLNARLNLDFPEEHTILTNEDILGIIKALVSLRDGIGEIDDIDNLANRRIRAVGEMIENQFRIALVRLSRAISERMGAVEVDTVMPHDLINTKLLSATVKDFFTSSQLSQFMDQTNPLSEITHKRRLSALGPGGLTRDRASFEVRDVHPTHYGRICPIETPEGQNIGLINSMATFARVNKYGFIESPYRKVDKSCVTDEVMYLSAIEEGKYIIAQANADLDDKGCFVADLVSCRKNGEFIMADPQEIHFIDVSPMQMVSVAASLIPFLENDDANRALMGSNMQRQAVPLLCADAPIVGTGMERIVASDSGAIVVSRTTGVVEQVDATRIVVRNLADSDNDSPGVEIYNLLKFQRSNYNTCINQKPLVSVGDKVKKGDVIADGPSTELGELALGRNVLGAFLAWNGYNFEDSILISERIVKDDVFTSVHIEEFECVARDTRLGSEEITRDIPNVSDEHLRHLDEVGIAHIGAEVKSGDILVGKVTPKSESPMTPEEKLLRAIFGEKAADVRDSSLHLPPGISGTVVDIEILTRRGIEKDQRALAIERQQIDRMAKDKDDELSVVDAVISSKIKNLLADQIVVSGPKGLKTGTVLTVKLLEDYTLGQWWTIAIEDTNIMAELDAMKVKYRAAVDRLNKAFTSNIERLQTGDDLPQGALKVVKIFIAMKHKLQPGDKMAGRHGNKGVISRILPVEDMPYLEDGTVVDIVLNPLGVPSRMNIGQILEIHLGWAAVTLGKQVADAIKEYHEKQRNIEQLKKVLVHLYDDKKIEKTLNTLSDEQLLELANNLKNGIPVATPVFDGAKETDIVNMLERANLDKSGQVKLIDGRTGEFFDRKVTVGYIYMLKLHHLVDDKIHARSIGPYSLVTQQPLGGKSHFGGQRLGEMECWALQAYGASYTLQEMLTVKSDDVNGRIKIYDSIIRGDNNFECGIPESFHVMIKELRSLCLNVELEQQKDYEKKN